MTEPGEIPSRLEIRGFENMEPSHYRTLMKSLGHMGLEVTPIFEFGSPPKLSELELTDSGLIKLPTPVTEPQDYAITQEDIDRVTSELGKIHMAVKIYYLLGRNTAGTFINHERFFSLREIEEALEVTRNGRITIAESWNNSGKTSISILKVLVADKRKAIEQYERQEAE